MTTNSDRIIIYRHDLYSDNYSVSWIYSSISVIIQLVLLFTY